MQPFAYTEYHLHNYFQNKLYFAHTHQNLHITDWTLGKRLPSGLTSFMFGPLLSTKWNCNSNIIKEHIQLSSKKKKKSKSDTVLYVSSAMFEHKMAHPLHDC